MRTIAYITDIHLNEQYPKELGVDAEKNWQLILEDVKSRNVNEIIFGGDIGEASAHNWFFRSLQEFKWRITLGNHDVFREVLKSAPAHLSVDKPELYYSDETTFLKYIFLDSSSSEISPLQLMWLEEQLKTGKKIILFLHHPILAVETAVDKLYPLKNRDVLKRLLLEIKNETVVFCGHYHLADEQTERNVTQVITCAASYQLEKDAMQLKPNHRMIGYRIIQIEKEHIQWELIELKPSDVASK